MFYFHISLLYIPFLYSKSKKKPVFSSKDFKIQVFFLICYFFHVISNTVNMLLMKKLMCYLVMASKTNGKSIASQSLMT